MTPYVKLALGFFDDPKFDDLSGTDIGLYVCLITLAGELRRDGELSRKKMVRRLHHFRNLRRNLKALENAGLVVVNGDIVAVKNYTKYQTTKSKIEAKKDADSVTTGYEKSDKEEGVAGHKPDTVRTQSGHSLDMRSTFSPLETANLPGAKRQNIELRINTTEKSSATPHSIREFVGSISNGSDLQRLASKAGWFAGNIPRYLIKRCANLAPIEIDEAGYALDKTMQRQSLSHPLAFFLGVVEGQRRDEIAEAAKGPLNRLQQNDFDPEIDTPKNMSQATEAAKFKARKIDEMRARNHARKSTTNRRLLAKGES